MSVSSSSPRSVSYISPPPARTPSFWKRSLDGDVFLPSPQRKLKIKNPDFPPRVLDKIHRVVDRCRYGLGEVWLSSSQNLDLECLPNGVKIQDYHPTQFSEGPIIRGECASLSTQVGKILCNDLGKHYDFWCVSGNYPNSPWSAHHLLLAFPKSKTDDYIAQLNKNPGQIPKDVLIVDPSYGLVGTKADHPRISEYFLDKNIATAKPAFSAWNTLAKEVQIPYGETPVPMGYSRTLLHESGKNWQEGETDDLLLIGFNKPHDNKPPGLYVIFHNASRQTTAQFNNWKNCKKIPHDSQLFQILTLMQNKLNASYCATQAKPTDQKPVQKNKAAAFR